MAKIIPKYKEGDFIIPTGNCHQNLFGRSFQIKKIFNNIYLLDTGPEEEYYMPWRIDIADNNSYLDKVRTILYG